MFDADSLWSPESIARQLADLQRSELWSESLGAALVQAVEQGGWADLSEVLNIKQRRRLRRHFEDFDWLQLGPEPAALLTIAGGAYATVASALLSIPKLQSPWLRLPEAGPHDTPHDTPPERQATLRELAGRGGLSLVAELPEEHRQPILAEEVSEWSVGVLIPGLFSDSNRGPWVAMAPELYQRHRPSPVAESWQSQAPWLFLSARTLMDAARRGQLNRTRKGTLSKACLRRQQLADLEPKLSHPLDLSPAESVLEILQHARLLEAQQNFVRLGPAAQDFQALAAKAQLELLIRAGLEVYDLGASPALVDAAFESLRRLLNAPQELKLDEPARLIILRSLRDGSLPSLADENSSFHDLAARLWPLTVPTWERFGLVECGLNARGFPVSCRPTAFALALYDCESLPPERRVSRSRQASMLLFEGPSHPCLAELTSSGRFLTFASPTVWKADPSPETWSQAAGALLKCFEVYEAPPDLKAEVKAAHKPRVLGRARSWYVLEVASADLVDQLERLPGLENAILERLTPTVLLLTGPSALTTKVQQAITELGIDLQIRD